MFYCSGRGGRSASRVSETASLACRLDQALELGGWSGAWLAHELVERPAERGGVTVIARGGSGRFRIGPDRPYLRYSLSPYDRVHTVP